MGTRIGWLCPDQAIAPTAESSSKFYWRLQLTSDLLIRLRSCIAALQSLTLHAHCILPQTTHREHDAPCQMGSLVGTDRRSRGVWTRLRGYGNAGAGDAALQHHAVPHASSPQPPW